MTFDNRAFENTYGDHLDALRYAMKIAIADALQEYLDVDLDEFYIGRVECDGQYAVVTVGVSNIADHVVNVDTDFNKIVTGP